VFALGQLGDCGGRFVGRDCERPSLRVAVEGDAEDGDAAGDGGNGRIEEEQLTGADAIEASAAPAPARTDYGSDSSSCLGGVCPLSGSRVHSLQVRQR
jgi:hypothetical protein